MEVGEAMGLDKCSNRKNMLNHRNLDSSRSGSLWSVRGRASYASSPLKNNRLREGFVTLVGRERKREKEVGTILGTGGRVLIILFYFSFSLVRLISSQ